MKEGYSKLNSALLYTFPNGKTIRVGNSQMLEHYDKIVDQFKYGKRFMEDDSL